MPTFTAIALDRLLEPVAPKSMAASKSIPDSRLERTESASISRMERGVSVPPRLEKGSSLPTSKTGRRNGTSATPVDRKEHWTQISPALYATPKSTPVPDSPSSFPPSPYIINHKRRGPRLLKSYSGDDVATSQQVLDTQEENDYAKNSVKKVASISNCSIHECEADPAKDNNSLAGTEKHENGTFQSVKGEHVNGTFRPVKEYVNGSCSLLKQEHANGNCNREIQNCEMGNGFAGQNDSGKSVSFNLELTGGDGDFLDPQDSTSVKSNSETDGNSGLERSMNLAAPVAEFYDAWEELSSDSGLQQPAPDIETELREIRLSLLMEIEKRKQAEEAVNIMRTRWQRIRSQLSSAGWTLPADPVTIAENEELDAEDLCQQIYIARFVSNTIGRGAAKAELEMEMEAQLELKNFEITRLWDRLKYYEAVNREMSQRNQEAVDTARRHRQRRKRRRRWAWGSIATAITLGSAVLAWSYSSAGKRTPSSNLSHACNGDHGLDH